MARHKNVDWNLPDNTSWDVVRVSVLMDLRDQLQKLNSLLGCHNAIDIPNILRRIERNTLSADAKLTRIRINTTKKRRRITRRQADSNTSR